MEGRPREIDRLVLQWKGFAAFNLLRVKEWVSLIIGKQTYVASLSPFKNWNIISNKDFLPSRTPPVLCAIAECVSLDASGVPVPVCSLSVAIFNFLS